MYLKQTILACLLITASTTLQAEQLILKEGYPERYVVQPGDTLWDISGKYLSEPWHWPHLWQINPQLANPHWIYPGDTLHLNWVNGTPQLSKVAHNAKPVIRLSPKMRYTSKAAPIPTLPSSDIAPFLQNDHILADIAQVKRLPYLLGANEKHLAMLEGQTLYVQGVLATGQDYAVYHLGTVYKDKVSGEILGQEAVLAGTIRAQAPLAEGRTRATLLHSQREVLQGDKLMPLPPQGDLPSVFSPKAAPAISPGYIIDLPSKARGGGKFDVVLINRGARDQLTAGDMLDIKRPGAALVGRDGKEEYKDFSSSYDKVFHSDKQLSLPAESIGKVMLFKIYDKLSYGLILQSQEIVSTGYQVTHF
ncbi:LysM peptidoglycan-binding domain-containing protein [Aeromonas cavernicola]|uniref:Peptidoglycan-binding protein n=1 Tax=Aeromonas cavernicola TaxID=1006623 RepID=A0A2H9U3T4_9GAMM|nr:LysM domain-containing protein [Aeromonas cavernicola]PJG58706.1 peptidoglycan-binding protein [Aeromonas cavernicola]